MWPIDAIRQESIAGRKAALVGMGVIGSEVAATLRQLGVKVVVEPLKLGHVIASRVTQSSSASQTLHGFVVPPRNDKCQLIKFLFRSVSRRMAKTLLNIT